MNTPAEDKVQRVMQQHESFNMNTPGVEQARRAALEQQQHPQPHHDIPLHVGRDHGMAIGAGAEERQALGEKLSGVERLSLQEDQERRQLHEEQQRRTSQSQPPLFQQGQLHQHQQHLGFSVVPHPLTSIERSKNDDQVPPMNCHGDFQLLPQGASDQDMKPVMNMVEKVLKELDVKYEVRKQSTTMHGDLAVVLCAIWNCHNVVHQMGNHHICSNIRFDTRPDTPHRKEE
ncbi:hypothetical protein BGZ83_010619 [Gryganskiella cystojenkinii]|nr:hypothetical protein BGZ83_010619 [Gryganskiella cystojenkinii]